jgi:hypothetical protein
MNNLPVHHQGLKRLALLTLPVLSLFIPGLAGATGYAVVPGSIANEIVLQIQFDQALAPVAVTAELLAHPDWLESSAIAIVPGPPQAVVLDFDVAGSAPMDARGVVMIHLEWRSGDGSNPSTLIRRVPLRVAAQAPLEQWSYRVEECCLPAAGLPHETNGLPVAPVLLGSTPNPSHSLTSIRFGLPPGDVSSVTLRIHDVTGRRVATLRTPALAAGYHEIAWAGRDDTGALVPSGFYFYELSTARWQAEGKMIILR